MSREQLLAAILDTPASRGPQRVYADWLIEQGDPRGEWIALHDNDTAEAELRRRALWQTHGKAWRAADVGTDALDALDHAKYQGGVLADVKLSEARLVALGPTLATQPIRSLRVYQIESLEEVAKLDVLRTVEHLDLGYGVENASAEAVVGLLDATPRLTSLTLSPHANFVMSMLERYDRLDQLEHLDVSNVRISPERAKSLVTKLSRLRVLRWSAGLTWTALEAVVEHATFELCKLFLSDHDGIAGRSRLLFDSTLASVLKSSFVRGLDVLSLFGCPSSAQVADALTGLPCAARLMSLDLGSNESSVCVRALADAELPKLRWLSVRHNLASDGDIESLRKLPTVTTLLAEKNHLSHAGIQTVVEAMPNLERLSIGSNSIGDPGVLAIAYGEHAGRLRHLEISSTSCTTDAVEALIECGRLTELRSLELACNAGITRPGIRALADGPFDKLARLSLAYVTDSKIEPLFEHSWLPLEQGGDNSYERRLALDGTAVPHEVKPAKRKPAKQKKVGSKAAARPSDATSEDKKTST